MSQSRGKLIVAILAFVVLAMASLACNESGEVAAAPEPTPEPTPWSKQDMMASAHEQDCAVFVFHSDDVGLAICVGSESLGGLTESGKEYMFKFDSNETANLSLCVRNPETGNYDFVQDIRGVSPGDYLSWDSKLSLGWTRH